ncbi:MAG: acetate--CoA ligase family protein [Ilumatobacteraceae bacterium]
MGSRTVLSESASKELLRGHGIPFAAERNVVSVADAQVAANEIGFPVAIKLNGDNISHKTERGLVRLGLGDHLAVEKAANELQALATPQDGQTSLLVGEMIEGKRELIAGLVVDKQFGPAIMLGTGGIYAEALGDVVFRILPLAKGDPAAMLSELKLSRMFSDFRGMEAVNFDDLDAVLAGIEGAWRERRDIASIDINPLIVRPDGHLVAVDAFVELGQPQILETQSSNRELTITDRHFEALLNPRGVVVIGASSHPGKFGFVTLHNILVGGYKGRIFATNRSGEEVLGVKTVTSIGELPQGEIDLAIICTPSSFNFDILGECAAKHISAVYVTTAGYGEADEEGRVLQQQLAAEADRLGLLLLGPNGQGLISTPVKLFAQIVAPFPPSGNISVASQSGNFASGFLNYSRQSNVGISRSISVGNAAQVSVGTIVDFYSRDDQTRVSLAYVEGVQDGRELMAQLSNATRSKPLVIVKGGATALGARAATSHTGSLASDDRMFDGMCRQIGASRAKTIEEAFDIAATFATQPLPRGPRTAVLTTVGGWGVVTTDALYLDGSLTLVELPSDLVDELNTLLPSRWSKSNPIDCAGGETRDTIPQILDRLASHSSIDAIIFLGIGVQSNQARSMREGRFYPDFGLERIVAYHERQDERFAQAADEASEKYDKPILTATELSVADPLNAGVVAVRQSGRMCYASGNRAVMSLGHLYRYAKYRGVAT